MSQVAGRHLDAIPQAEQPTAWYCALTHTDRAKTETGHVLRNRATIVSVLSRTPCDGSITSKGECPAAEHRIYCATSLTTYVRVKVAVEAEAKLQIRNRTAIRINPKSGIIL
jgi:hypothetical protein